MLSIKRFKTAIASICILTLVGCGSTEKDSVGNKYFYEEASAEHTYTVEKFFFEDVDDITVKSELLASYEGGNVYSVDIQYEDIQERYFDTADRYDIGTFYVTKDNIYLLNHVEGVPSEEDFLSNGIIVCSDNGSEQNPTDYEVKIEINEDNHKCSFWNPLVETGYYCNMIWTKDKGLTYFRSGFGAERDPIEISLKEKD